MYANVYFTTTTLHLLDCFLLSSSPMWSLIHILSSTKWKQKPDVWIYNISWNELQHALADLSIRSYFESPRRFLTYHDLKSVINYSLLWVEFSKLSILSDNWGNTHKRPSLRAGRLYSFHSCANVCSQFKQPWIRIRRITTHFFHIDILDIYEYKLLDKNTFEKKSALKNKQF